ncbi:MAG TPA: hypothetical protein VG078_09355, partial [Acidimicrobiales bacterium]|nr:hypothetical protein [Acidimicrobiales bacterium]
MRLRRHRRRGPLAFRGDLRRPASFVDFRLYLARLLEDYEERGGRVFHGPASAEDVVRLGNRQPLVVVASGGTSSDALFPSDPTRRATRSHNGVCAPA